MGQPTNVSSPPAVLFSGLFGGVCWIVGLNFLYELPRFDLILLLTTCAFTAVCSAAAALALSFLSRRDKERHDAAEYAARHDNLTGLKNRAELFRLLEESVHQAKRDNTVLGVLFLDLDRFKAINDSMGHDAGDELLRCVANRLRSSVRSTDIVARLGGDEFVVLCRELISGDSVEAAARQIQKQFKDPVDLNGRDHLVSTSIGVAIAQADDDRDADELLRDADAAMYRAKRTKSGYAVFDEAHRKQVLNRLDIERELVQALEKGELVVFYQPIVDTSNQSLYAFEALVRWNHPELGVVGPGYFLEIAEEAGMMSDIGTMVLREACAQAAVWNHISLGARNVKMSVNLAEQQLIDPSLPAKVGEILKWSGLDPQQLVLEITENIVVEHLASLSMLRELENMGIYLAIDDFGTGQSGLSYIKQFDMVSTIKIDQAFVRDMRSGDADRAIIEAIVAMSGALDLRVVAEGVEFEDQKDQLIGLGVNFMQGYLFNSPVSPESIEPQVWFPDGVEARDVGLSSDQVQQSFAQAAQGGIVTTEDGPTTLSQWLVSED